MFASWWWLALAAGAALRAAFVLHHPRIAGDALVYGDLAHNLLAHGIFGLTEETIRPTLIRLPGYPLFLALCFAVFGDAHYVPVLWVQAALDLLSCVLLASLAGRLWGRRASLATLWLAAMCPFTANYTAVAIAETTSIFCVVLAFYSLERWRSCMRRQEGENTSARATTLWAAVLGAASAVAVLLRPDQGLLAVAVLSCMTWIAWRAPANAPQKHPHALRLLAPSIAAAIFVLPLFLWGARNWRVFHVVQPLAPRYANDPGEFVNLGFQRWFRTWALDFKASLDVYWPYDGSELRLSDLPARAFDSPRQKAETASLYELYNEQQAASPPIDAAFARLAAERVAAHPLRYYVALPAGRMLNMWLRPRTELMKLPVAWWQWRAHPLGSAVALAYAGLNAAYLLLAAVGLRRWWRARWTGNSVLAVAMLGFVLLRCLLLLTVDNSEPRYTLECFPIVFLLSGLALGRLPKPATHALNDGSASPPC